MVRLCYLCKRRYEKASTRSYHRFPDEEAERLTWFHIIGMEVTESKFTYLCSDHFASTDFYVKPNGTRMLRRGSKPINVLPSGGQSMNIPAVDVNSSSSSSSAPTVIMHSQVSSEGTEKSSVLAVPLSSSSTTKSAPETLEYQSKPIPSVEECKAESAIMGPPRKRLKKLRAELQRSDELSHASSSITESAESAEQLLEGNVPGTQLKKRLPVKRRRNPRYVGECVSSEMDTPRKARRNWHIAKKTITIQKKKLRTIQQQNRRLRSRVVCLKSLLKHLTDTNMITDTAKVSVEASIPPAFSEVMKRLLKGSSRQAYSPELRAFALTLNFYSSKAYNYVRMKFNKSLPHPKTISKWYSSINGAPGYTQEALNAIKMKVTETEAKGYKVLCNLVMDEMSIRKQVEWTGKKYSGYVDVGANVDSDSLPEAKEVLVFMLVALNGHWKIPVGYFFLAGLNGTEKANLVNKCLEFLNETGVIVTSFTFDGTATNLSMASTLGGNFDNVSALEPYFKHPTSNYKLCFYLDPCHMLKLVRNCLGSKGELTDSEGGKILWVYFMRLVDVQDFEGLHAANKLRQRHLQWAREKMKVKIAAQTFSNSVADALLFLGVDLKFERFQNVEPTAKFCKLFNNLFDIFNARNWLSRTYYRKPLSASNYADIFEYLLYCKNYIIGLKLDEIPVLSSNRKTGFLGFLICIESLQFMYQEYIACETPLLKYILTYKISQDHLEIFFSAVRSKGGSNNNPTARQFESIYKRLLLHTEIKGADSGNAVALDSTSILYSSSTSCRSLTCNDVGTDLLESDNFLTVQREVEDHDYLSTPVWHLTSYVEDVVAYISGFVVKCLKQCVTCAFCCVLLQTDDIISNLQRRKQYGAMYHASPFVVTLCKTAEKCIRYIKAERNIFQTKNLVNLLVHSTIRNLPRTILEPFGNHITDDELFSTHCFDFIKLILKTYFKIRLHHESKRLQEADKTRVRSLLTKLILFKNQ